MSGKMFHFSFILMIAGISGMALPLRAADHDWNVLKSLKLGQQIMIVGSDDATQQGPLQLVDDEQITAGQGVNAKSVARKDVKRVYLREKNHRLRNTVIGAGIGAGLAALAVKANHWGENTGIRNIGWVWPVGIGTFAGVGAVIPTGGWLLVYRAPRHR